MKEYEPSLVISPLGQLLTLIWPFDLLTQTAGTATTPLPHSLWEPPSPSYWPQVRLRRSQVAADSLVCLQDAPPGAHYGKLGLDHSGGAVVWCGVVWCQVRLVSGILLYVFFFFILTSNRQMDKHAADAKSVQHPLLPFASFSEWDQVHHSNTRGCFLLVFRVHGSQAVLQIANLPMECFRSQPVFIFWKFIRSFFSLVHGHNTLRAGNGKKQTNSKSCCWCTLHIRGVKSWILARQ